MAASDVVPVTHPIPLLLVPRGGRRPRAAFERTVTPVRLRAASAAEMPRLATVTMPFGNSRRFDLHEHAGGLWTPLTDAHGDPLPLATVLDFLRGEQRWVEGTDLGRAFGHGPLLAPAPLRPDRGAEGVRAGAQVIRDWTDRARADLADRLDASLRLCGDRAFVRVPGPMCQREILGPPGSYGIVVHPMAHVLYDSHVPLDGYEADWRRRLDKGIEPPRNRREPARLLGAEGLEAWPGTDDDLGVALNQAPAAVWSHVGYSASKLGPATRDAFMAGEGAFLERHALSALGLLRGPELAETATFLHGVAARVLADSTPATPGIKRVRAAVDFMAEVALPRLVPPEPEPSPEDADALSALQPGF